MAPNGDQLSSHVDFAKTTNVQPDRICKETFTLRNCGNLTNCLEAIRKGNSSVKHITDSMRLRGAEWSTINALMDRAHNNMGEQNGINNTKCQPRHFKDQRKKTSNKKSRQGGVPDVKPGAQASAKSKRPNKAKRNTRIRFNNDKPATKGDQIQKCEHHCCYPEK
ncbi:unnamed protein product [Hermetia illucens]|uniref:Uncharacterized protein n=1 Tax=Hermetia illucens TaxID=343691 RepID=A0A7R8UHR5_HERIL|nr:unnamed protein product [Hermetia illucens]